jgi:serine/threonine protein phosphatase PrpC
MMRGAGPLDYVTTIEEAARGRGEDRLAVVRMADRTVFAVADGAGGVVAGATAAEAVCDAVVEQCRRGVPRSWSEWLTQLDRRMPRAGLAAAVVVEVRHDGGIVGASAGDCCAWMIAGYLVTDLTANQQRRPLLGEGKAVPVDFDVEAPACMLVVATDGLWKFASRARIVRASTLRPLESAATALVEGARLGGGSLQDDVAIAIVEVRRKLPTP